MSTEMSPEEFEKFKKQMEDMRKQMESLSVQQQQSISPIVQQQMNTLAQANPSASTKLQI